MINQEGRRRDLLRPLVFTERKGIGKRLRTRCGEKIKGNKERGKNTRGGGEITR